jgi:hypothetical protein
VYGVVAMPGEPRVWREDDLAARGVARRAACAVSNQRTYCSMPPKSDQLLVSGMTLSPRLPASAIA